MVTTNSNRVLRRAKPQDTEGIHEAHMRSIREVCSKDHPPEEIKGWGNRPYREDQRLSAIENHLVWVIDNQGAVEGYCQLAISKKETLIIAYVFGLYLIESVNGLGFGKKMVQIMIEEAKKLDAVEITLESTITAHAFYKKMGFIDKGPKIIAQIGGGPVTCFPMRLKL